MPDDKEPTDAIVELLKLEDKWKAIHEHHLPALLKAAWKAKRASQEIAELLPEVQELVIALERERSTLQPRLVYNFSDLEIDLEEELLRLSKGELDCPRCGRRLAEFEDISDLKEELEKSDQAIIECGRCRASIEFSKPEIDPDDPLF